MPHDFMPGLAGVPAAKSAVSDVDGYRGVLEYRGIHVEDLCAKSSYLETAFLLLFGHLPTLQEMTQWTTDITRHRRIKFKIIDLLKCMPEQGHPMDALQAAVAALGMFYPGRKVKDGENNYWSVVRLVAKLPTIVAAWTRLRRGDDPIPPRDELGFSENFLYMLTEQVPPPLWNEILDDCFILHAEHTMNASTFTGLVTASTLADPYTVVASSIGALKGPLHGGANEEVVQMLREIGSPDRAIMIHQVHGGAQGQASDVERQVDYMFKLKKRIIRIISQHTVKSEEQVRVDSDSDYYMSAEEARAYGLVDEVIKSRKEVKLMDGSTPPDGRLVEVPEVVLSRKG